MESSLVKNLGLRDTRLEIPLEIPRESPRSAESLPTTSLAFSAATQAHQLADRRLTRRGCALCTDCQNAVQDLRCCCLPCRRGCVPGWLARVARERAQGVDGDGRGRRRVAGRARQGTGARTLLSRGARAQPCAEALPAASCPSAGAAAASSWGGGRGTPLIART